MPADASGVEALPGESEADYVARQQRLKEEAAARMRAKFGGSGGLNGGMRMGGIGSNAAMGSGGSAEFLSSSASALGSSASAGLSSLASASSWLIGSAASKAAEVYSTVSEKTSYSGTADVGMSFARERNHSCGDHSVLEGSRDLSDLLGGPKDDARPSPPQPKATPPAPPPKALPEPPPRMEDDWGASWGASSATSAPTPTKQVHVTSPSGMVGRRKVAAAKADPSSWDDWGDDKW